VDRILDLSWIHAAVRDRYCQDNGRPSIDPEAALRLMLAGFFYRITGDRALMREAQVNIAIRWFIGYRLDEQLPDRSSLTTIRQRWGDALYREVFERTVKQCMQAGLVNAQTVHIDATLIRADVSWDSVVTRHVEQVIVENDNNDEDDNEHPPTGGRGRRQSAPPKQKKYSPTDPDATMATSSHRYHLEPTYKQHTAVEDTNGVIVNIEVTTGEVNEGHQLIEQVERIESLTGKSVETVTADCGYAHPANYASLEAREIDAVIPPQSVGIRKNTVQRLPLRRFKYDAHKDRVTCPAGKHLHRSSRNMTGHGYWYRARSIDCKICPLRDRCIPSNTNSRNLLIVDNYPALLRARRRKEKGWDDIIREKYIRHRWHIEGVHGRAKEQHGLRRAARRGLAEVRIQCYLTAAVMNLKKLAITTERSIQRFISSLLRSFATINTANFQIFHRSAVKNLCASAN
jgi:transposase